MATYSFLDVHCALSGPGGVAYMGGDSGGVSDEGITVEQTEDLDTMTNGADGSTMHSLHAARPGRVTIRLLKTSPMNAVLSTLMAYQTASSTNHGQNTIVVSNTSAGDVVTCTSVAFTRHTGVSYAKDANMNEWSFNVGKVRFLMGTY